MLDWAVLVFVALPIPELVAYLVTLSTLATFSGASSATISTTTFASRIALLSGRSGLRFIRVMLVLFNHPVSV